MLHNHIVCIKQICVMENFLVYFKGLQKYYVIENFLLGKSLAPTRKRNKFT